MAASPVLPVTLPESATSQPKHKQPNQKMLFSLTANIAEAYQFTRVKAKNTANSSTSDNAACKGFIVLTRRP